MADLCHLVVVSGPRVPVDGTHQPWARLHLDLRTGLTFEPFGSHTTPFNPHPSLYLALDPPARSPAIVAHEVGGCWEVEASADGDCFLWSKVYRDGSRCPNHPSCPYRASIVQVSRSQHHQGLPCVQGTVTTPNLRPLDVRGSGPRPKAVRSASGRADDLDVLAPVSLPSGGSAHAAPFGLGPTLLRRAVIREPGRVHTRTDLVAAAIDLPGVRDALIDSPLARVDLVETYPAGRPPTRTLRVTIDGAGHPARPWGALFRRRTAGPPTDPLSAWLTRLLGQALKQLPGEISGVEFIDGQFLDPVPPASLDPGADYLTSDPVTVAGGPHSSWLHCREDATLGAWLLRLDQVVRGLVGVDGDALAKYVNTVLVEALGGPDQAGTRYPALAANRLFTTLVRVPFYLLRPPGTNPWPARLFAWWLGPPSDPLANLRRAGVSERGAELRCSTTDQLEAALTASPLGRRIILASGYLGRGGERFILGKGSPSRLGADPARKPSTGESTDWGDVFRRDTSALDRGGDRCAS